MGDSIQTMTSFSNSTYLPLLANYTSASPNVSQSYNEHTAVVNGSISVTPPYSSGVTGVLAGLAAVTSLCTVAGNILVVMAFILERNIRQPSNYLIASLAITDILIGLFSMPLYTLYLLKAYWPLGKTLCNLWLSLDYTVCLVSQYTVFLITLDRFCMVKAPAKYRNWRTKNKIKFMIGATWFIPALIFFTSIMGWDKFVRHTVQEPQQPALCYAKFQTNSLFTAILVISYYWVTVVIMIGLYIGIYRVALSLHRKAQAKRDRMKALTQLSQGPKNNNFDMQPLQSATEKSVDTLRLTQEQKSTDARKSRDTGHEDSDFSTDSTPRADQEHGESSTANQSNNSIHFLEQSSSGSPLWKPRRSLDSPDWEVFDDSTYSSMHRETSCDEKQIETQTLCQEKQALKSVATQTKAKLPSKITSNVFKIFQNLRSINLRQEKTSPRAKSKSENRARKALRTITFILGAFVLCWTPYHVIVLISAFCPIRGACVNVTLSEFSYWLCYVNSPVNPFCYAFANQQFKRTFIKIMKGEYFSLRKCRN